MRNPSSYRDAVARLERTIGAEKRDYMKETGKDKAFFLTRMQHLCDALDNPERAFRTIHVAGSSGKGTTATMIHNILVEAGWSSGLYTSPHVTTSLERVQIGSRLVDPAQFGDGVDAVLTIVQDIAILSPELLPSYAEIFFAVALWCFQKENVQWMVLETGCGGRFDKTNIIPPPERAVLTPIDFEHAALLGPTLPDIAWHKVGILKNGSYAFSAPQTFAVRTVVEQEAQTRRVPLSFVAQRNFDGPAHHRTNASLADAVTESLGIDATIRTRGIAQTRLPAHIEKMQNDPLVILDGAHSPAKIGALVACLKNQSTHCTRIILAAKEGKDIHAIIAPLLPLATTVTFTTFHLPGFHGVDPQELLAIAQSFSPSCTLSVETDAREALHQTLTAAHSDDRIIITGSFYLAGIMRTHWIAEDDIITQRSPFPFCPSNDVVVQ